MSENALSGMSFAPPGLSGVVAPSWAQNPGRSLQKRRKSGGKAEEKRRRSGGEAEGKRRKAAREIPRRS